MPKTFNVEGIGPVNFPDDATDEDVLSAVNDFAPAKFEPPHTPEPGWSPVGEETPTTPEMQQAVNLSLQNIDPRWNVRPPEPTIGRLIGQGMEWINRTFKAPEEPMPPPLTPIVVPPSPEESPETVAKRQVQQSLYAAEHPLTAGVGRTAEKLLSTLAEPAGPLAIAATPLAPEVLLPAWSAMGTEGSLDAIRRIQRARETGDRAAYFEAAADLGVNLEMARSPRHLRARLPVELPRTLAALREEPGAPVAPTEPAPPGEPVVPQPAPETEVPSAIQERSPETLPVAARPEVSPEVERQVRSAQEPALPQETPGNGAGREAQTRPEVPLSAEEQAAARAQLEAEVPAAQPITAAERGKPAEPAPAEAPAPTATAAPTPPAAPGPGAASPSEFDPTKPFETSVKNAVTEAKRATRGMPAVEEEAARKWGDVWQSVKDQVAEDPGAPDRLVAELRDRPRAVTDREDAMLLHQQVSLEELFNRTAQDMVRLAETESEAIPEHRLRLANISDRLLELYDVDKSVGRETARGLNARKMMSDETYSLVRMELAKRAANDGRRLTPEEQASITALHDKIAATQKAFDEHVAKSEARIRELETQHAVDELKIAAAREARADTASGTVRDLDAERANITAGLGERAPNAPLRDLRPWIRKLALNLVRSGITERDPLVNAVHAILKDILPGIDRRATMDAISGYGDFRPLDPEAAKAQLRDLSGQMQNVAKLEDLLARKALKKTGPERKTPSNEERRLTKLVNEYKKRYGVVVTDPAAQLKSALDAVKTRLRNSIADLDFQIKTGKRIVKGATKVAYDAEAQALVARRDALKAQFDEVFGKPELTDEQRIAMAKRALESSIAELQRRIAAGETRTARAPSKTPITEQLQVLRDQRDALRGQLDYMREILDPKKTPEQIALASLKTRLRNATADLRERTARGDFSKPGRRSVALDAEAQALKADNLRAREQFQRDLLKDRLKQRTTAERWTDNVVKLRRFSILSSPVTLAKLTAAAVQRMVFSPLEEAIGAGIAKLPGYGEVARRAPIEGGFSAAAEAKAATSAFTLGMKDAAQTLRTGRSNLERLYGGRTPEGGFKEGSLLPRSWMDWFGELHGAFKAPVKRAAFERAMQKQIEFGIRNGIDTTDPMVLASYGVEAYKAANRSIFLQDNELVSSVNSFLAKRIAPRTGHPTTASQIKSTAGRVLLPIVRVPTNIVAEAMQYATGSVTGNVRLARALRRGIETLPPEEADLIMRQLKKGSIGAAFLITGYLLPEFIGGYYQPHEKRDKADVQVGAIGPAPSYLLHNPLLETLQLGSTVRRVADSSLTKKHPQEQGLMAGVVSGALGLTEEVPAMREIVELAKVFDPNERAAFFGELTKSLVVPQVLQWVARQMDKDSAGEVIPRKPGTFLEHIETGVPGLRQDVPEPKRASR